MDTCSEDGCADPIRVRSRGLCNKHYQKLRRSGGVPKSARRYCECGNPAFGHGLCQRHYMQRRRKNPAAPRCADGCGRAATTRGLCDHHYAVTYLPEMVRRHATSPETRARSKKWRQENPERWLMLQRNRKHRIRAQSYGVPVTKLDLEQILADHGMVCHICGEDIESRADLHFDHVIPLSKGGPHAVENIRPSHALCNLRKAARLGA